MTDGVVPNLRVRAGQVGSASAKFLSQNGNRFDWRLLISGKNFKVRIVWVRRNKSRTHAVGKKNIFRLVSSQTDWGKVQPLTNGIVVQGAIGSPVEKRVK